MVKPWYDWHCINWRDNKTIGYDNITLYCKKLYRITWLATIYIYIYIYSYSDVLLHRVKWYDSTQITWMKLARSIVICHYVDKLTLPSGVIADPQSTLDKLDIQQSPGLINVYNNLPPILIVISAIIIFHWMIYELSIHSITKWHAQFLCSTDMYPSRKM